MALRQPSLVVGAMVAALLVPGTAMAQFFDDDAAEELDEAESEFDDAIRSLEDLEARIARAEQQVEAAERRLTGATATLDGLEDEVAAAEQALARAETAVEQTADELRRAEQAAVDADEAELAAVALLQERAVEVFKNGVAREQQALVLGVIGAKDWHDATINATTFGRMIEDDAVLVAEAARSREQTVAARARADLARVEAVVAEDAAADEQAGLVQLVEDQREAVLAVVEERRRREAVMSELEQDSEVTALLLGKLQEQIGALEALPPPPPPPPAPPPPPPEPEPEPEPRDEPAPAPAPEPGPRDAPAPAPAPEPDPPAPEPSSSHAAPAWAANLPPAGRPFAADIDAAARRHGIDGRLLAALVWRESNFDPTAVSSAGARGLTQLMPGTAASLGVTDSFDPEQSLDGGASYLARRINQFGSIELGLAAYNSGPVAVQRHGGVPPFPETQLYVIRVLEYYQTVSR